MDGTLARVAAESATRTVLENPAELLSDWSDELGRFVSSWRIDSARQALYVGSTIAAATWAASFAFGGGPRWAKGDVKRAALAGAVSVGGVWLAGKLARFAT